MAAIVPFIDELEKIAQMNGRKGRSGERVIRRVVRMLAGERQKDKSERLIQLIALLSAVVGARLAGGSKMDTTLIKKLLRTTAGGTGGAILGSHAGVRIEDLLRKRKNRRKLK